VTLGAVLALCGSVACTLAVAQPAAGAITTLFVSSNGSDTNPCSAVAPCATITHALMLAGSGNIIEVAGTISDGDIGGASGISDTLTVEQWPGQAPAVVDGAGKDSSVFVVSTGNLTLNGVIVSGGSALSARNEGGGILNQSGTLTITNSTVTNNTALTGAGISSFGALTIKNSTISHNTASSDGGGISSFTANIADSTISDNTVDGAFAEGGGLTTTGSTTITDSTIAGNTVVTTNGIGQAAGILTASGVSTTLTATTISDNSAEGGAEVGGLVNEGRLTIGATIVAGNTGPFAIGDSANCSNSLGMVSVTSNGYNLTDDATGTACGFTQTTDVVNASPGLGPLANNGGLTQTQLPAPNSPAVGVIPSPTTLNGVPVCGPGALDQRGVPRPSPRPKCTIGAVEAAPEMAPTITSAHSTLFTAGTNGSFTVTASGVPPPGLSVSTGASQTGLPQGVGFTDNGDGSATLSGIATTPGSYTFTIVASNGVSPPAAETFVLVVQASLPGGAAMTALPNGTGYWTVHSDGGVFSFGAAPFLGSLPGIGIHVSNIVGIATTPDGKGYWLVGSDGGVYAFGDATYMGSMGGKPLNKPVVAMAATTDGGGYWLVASDGGVFSFGDATFSGSMGATPLNKPMVAMSADPAGGYWLVASDGGIFSFGGAPFFGSMGGTRLVEPVVGVTSAPGGTGYWLVARDGGVFAFGKARFAGSLGGSALSIIGLFSTNAGDGYTLVEANGTAHPF